jgi:DNA-binding beta-propeller fold protein YncE
MQFFAKIRCTLAALLVLSLFACDRTPDEPIIADYSNGVYVVNEGPFGSGTGTVDFYHRNGDSVSTNIFAKANSGAVLGNIAQSMQIINNQAFVIVNNAGKIEVVDPKSFESIRSISGFSLPYTIFKVNDQKAYVSQWGADGLTGSIAVVNLSNNSIEKTVSVGKGPLMPVRLGSKIYVPLSGGFGSDTRIAVLDAATDNVVQTIEVGAANPIIVADESTQTIYCLAKGAFDFTNPANNQPGALLKIKNDQVQGTPVPLPTGGDNLVLSADKKTLYFTVNGTIQSSPAEVLAPTVFDPSLTFSAYALGVDPQTGYLWAADAKNFTDNGEVIVLKPNKTIEKRLQVGIIPTDFLFVD